MRLICTIHVNTSSIMPMDQSITQSGQRRTPWLHLSCHILFCRERGEASAFTAALDDFRQYLRKKVGGLTGRLVGRYKLYYVWKVGHTLTAALEDYTKRLRKMKGLLQTDRQTGRLRNKAGCN